MAAQSGSASVSLLLHGVTGGCPNARSPHQEGAEGPAEDGGQFPQVHIYPPFVDRADPCFLGIIFASLNFGFSLDIF